MNKDILFELGLTKNEVEIYIALLSLGASTAITLAKESKVHRSNTYDALTGLSNKSLVSHITKEKVKYYEAIDPEQLLQIVKSKAIQVESIIPELKLLQINSLPKTDVNVIEGINGARKALADVLENTTKYYALGVPKDYPKTIGEGWLAEWHETRLKKKIWFHHLVNEDYDEQRIKKLKSMKYTTIKFLPNEYGTPNLLLVYDKGVLLSFMKPMITIRILNEDIVKSFKNYYNMLDKLANDKRK